MKFLASFAVALCALFLQAESAAVKVKWTMPSMAIKKGAKPSNVINGQIIGGLSATLGQFPYQANIITDGSSLCGGSLISTRWILTAAHCTQGASYVIRLGTVNWQQNSPGTVTMTSTTEVNHASYNPTTLINDIALIQLPSAVTLTANIKTIALPSKADASNTFANYVCVASGWGLTADGGSASPTLNYANLTIITNSVCQQTFGSTSIVSSTVCTSGASGKSTCQGDSGGPLVCTVNGVKKLIGVVSFGGPKCQAGYPQAFSRVTSYLTWINSKTGIVIA